MNHNESLVRMANQIAQFFESYPDHEEAVAAVANHLTKFWDPRMRKAIIAYREGGGEGLREMAAEAIARIATEMAPG